MEKLKFLPTTMQAFVSCERCGDGRLAADCYGTEDGAAFVCKDCITDDERQHLTLSVQVDQLAGHVGYLEAAERNYDHTQVEDAKARLRRTKEKLSALWQKHCAPLIASGEVHEYGSPEHRQAAALAQARRIKG